MIKSLMILLILWSASALEAEVWPAQNIIAWSSSAWTLLFLILNRKVLTSLI